MLCRNQLHIYRSIFPGSLGFVMYNIFVGILQAIGDSRHPLYYLMISSVINLVLDILFIEVFHTGVGGSSVSYRNFTGVQRNFMFDSAADPQQLSV